MGAPEGIHRPHIFPVSLKREGIYTGLSLQQLGNDVLAEVMGGFGVGGIPDQLLAQIGPAEYINSHGRQIGFRTARFLLECGDPVIGIHRHNAEAACFLQGNPDYRYSGGGIPSGMEVQKVTVVHMIDVIGGENQDVLRVELIDVGDIFIDGICCAGVAFILLQAGRKQGDIGIVCAQMPVQGFRPVLCKHADLLNACIEAVA
ncbi:hypothetical protein D3C75_912030 [compost metagenome]